MYDRFGVEPCCDCSFPIKLTRIPRFEDEGFPPDVPAPTHDTIISVPLYWLSLAVPESDDVVMPSGSQSVFELSSGLFRDHRKPSLYRIVFVMLDMTGHVQESAWF